MSHKKVFSALSISLILICSLHAETDQSSPYYQLGYTCPLRKSSLDLLKNPLKTVQEKVPSSKEFKTAFGQLKLFMKGREARFKKTPDRFTYLSYRLLFVGCFTQADEFADALIALGTELTKISENFNSGLNPGVKEMANILLTGTPSRTSQSYKLSKELATEVLNYLLSVNLAEKDVASGFLMKCNPLIKPLRTLIIRTDQAKFEKSMRDAYVGFKEGIDSYSLENHLAGKDKHIKLLITFIHKVFKLLPTVPQAFKDNDLSPFIKSLGKEIRTFGEELKKIS